jgi:hypothetical protein
MAQDGRIAEKSMPVGVHVQSLMHHDDVVKVGFIGVEERGCNEIGKIVERGRIRGFKRAEAAADVERFTPISWRWPSLNRTG